MSDRRLVCWTAAMATGLSALAFALHPHLLVPLARLYRALCERFPTLAIISFHLPPLPVALVILITAIAVGSGAAAGVSRLIATIRFNRRLRHAAGSAPPCLARLAPRLGLRREQITYLIWPEPVAFCYGLLRPRVAVSAGLCARLDDEALLAVLAHEFHHLRRRDPLRYLVLHICAAAAFMLPLARDLRRRREVRIELAADRAALAVVPRGALAAALQSALSGVPRPVIGAARLSTTEARIAHLAGRPLLPPIPRGSLFASIAVLVVVTVAAVDLAASAELVTMVCKFCPAGPGGAA